jgi:predicted metal-dependent phosphoesterase TrpH
VHDAGGIAVWAHPGPEARRDRVEPLVAAGLDGLEVLHPRHGAEDEARLGALVDFFGLVSSGGSDWHGTTDGYACSGRCRCRSPCSRRRTRAWPHSGAPARG